MRRMTITSVPRRAARPIGALVLSLALAACGGGGGGGDGAPDPGGHSDAEILACQETLQSAGWTLLDTSSDALATCGDGAMACQLASELGGATAGETEACFTTADAACRSALDGADDARDDLAATATAGCDDVAFDEIRTALAGDAWTAICGSAPATLPALVDCLAATVDCAAFDAFRAEAPRAPAVLAARGISVGAGCPGAASATVAQVADAALADAGSIRARMAAAVAGTQPQAEFVVTGENGSLFDGVIDGFPGIATQDGVADLAGNALAVALKTGATEERGIGEFPLAQALDGLTAAEIESVTLTFNIDDVLSTFGPGTDFSGVAASTIRVFTYSGDGTIALADFQQASGSPAATVDTSSHGTITDATLTASGPLEFEVDLTDEVRALVTANATHLGIVWMTDTNDTGTSIDNLGNGGAGPPGVGGSRLPFLTIRASGTPPVCGDGNVDAGEQCDDGSANSSTQPDACRTNCTNPRCGDDVVDTGESCDDGNTNAGDGCDAACDVEVPASCGDGTTDAGEECDDGTGNSNTTPDACRENCTNPRCGDTVVDTGEQCDPPGGTCRSDCTTETEPTDPSASFIACQAALLEAASRFSEGAGDAIQDCLDDTMACQLEADAGDDASACFAGADAACAAASTAADGANAAFVANALTACAGRPAGDIIGALGYTALVADCGARGLPTTTLADVAGCVADEATCSVQRGASALTPRAATTASSREGLSSTLHCLGDS